MAQTSQEFDTIIGADASFKGDLEFNSTAKVLGRIEGSITAKGKIHIAEGANCKATVRAKEVAVEGHIQGNVEAAERIELKPSGAVTGDIVAARMTMSDGAAIDGHCRIGVNGQPGASQRPGATSEVKPSAVQPSKQGEKQAQPAHAGKK